MGEMGEWAVLDQLKKAQDETNERLDRLIAAHEQTYQLLERLLNASTPRTDWRPQAF